MIHPSYVDLMKVVNKGVEEGETPVINSRYSIVMATAKRARQIVNQDEPLIENTYGRKPLSIAVEELNEGKIRILSEEEALKQEEAAREKQRELEEAAALEAEAAMAEEEGEEESESEETSEESVDGE